MGKEVIHRSGISGGENIRKYKKGANGNMNHMLSSAPFAGA